VHMIEYNDRGETLDLAEYDDEIISPKVYVGKYKIEMPDDVEMVPPRTEREPGYLVHRRKVAEFTAKQCTEKGKFVEGSSLTKDIEMLSLEDEEALYYEAQEVQGEDENLSYGDLLTDYDDKYDHYGSAHNDGYEKVLGLIRKTNKNFTEAAFNLDLSLKLRQDLIVQVYDNALLYHHIYNKLVQKSDFVNLRDPLICCPTYNVGNMHKYSSCKGNQEQYCPCLICTEKCAGETLWMCDSSASDHFTFNLEIFSSYSPFEGNNKCWVKTADSMSPLLGQGTVIIKHTLKSAGTSHLIKLYPVLYMPSATAHLISNGRLCKQGLVAEQNDECVVFTFKNNQKTYIEGFGLHPNDMLTFCKGYVVITDPEKVLPHLMESAHKVDYETWHKRLGHPFKNILNELEKNVNRYKKVEIPKEKQRCEGCLKGKMKTQPYKESLKRASKPLEMIHMDLMECPIQSYHKYKYICVVVDDFSSYTWIGLLSLKSDALKFFTNWCNKASSPSQKITYLCSDCGGEFVNQAFDKFLSDKGIIHQKSSPHVHQQNGCVECMNQTLTDKAEAMQLDAHCPKSWWEFAFDMAVHVYNQTPLRCTRGKTPLENLTCKKLDVAYLHVFGCEAWVFIPQEKHTDKLSPKSEHMTFIGYELNSKAYKFMTSNNSIVISSQATFFEDRFPRKGKDSDTITKDIGQIWEEPKKDAPENLENNQNPNYDNLLPEMQGHCCPDQRGAFPDPAQPQDPLQDPDDNNSESSFEMKEELDQEENDPDLRQWRQQRNRRNEEQRRIR
jgi:hypothetical protein